MLPEVGYSIGAVTAGIYAAKYIAAAMNSRGFRNDLEKIIGNEAIKTLKDELMHEGRERGKDWAVTGDHLLVQCKTTNADGYLSKVDLALESRENLELVLKYKPKKSKKGLMRRIFGILPGESLCGDEIVTGGLIQRYLRNLVGLSQVPNALIVSDRIGNVTYLEKGKVPLKECKHTFDDQQKEEIAGKLIDFAVDMATAPVRDRYFVKGILFRGEQKHTTRSARMQEQLDGKKDAESFKKTYAYLLRYIDKRAGFLSHNDLRNSNNILLDQELNPVVIDFDHATFQNYYYDVDDIIRTLGFRNERNKNAKKRLQERVVRGLKKNMAFVNSPITVPGKNGEVVISTGMPYDEFELTSLIVEFDNDFQHALKLEEISQKEEDAEYINALQDIAAHRYTRAGNTLKKVAGLFPGSENRIVQSYQRYLAANNIRTASDKEFCVIEQRYNPDEGTTNIVQSHNKVVSLDELEARESSHAKAVAESNNFMERAGVLGLFGLILPTAAIGSSLYTVNKTHPEIFNLVLDQAKEIVLPSAVLAVALGVLGYSLGSFASRRDQGRVHEKMFYQTSKENRANYLKD